MVVHQLQDVDAAVGHHAQAAAEHEEADAKCAPPGRKLSRSCSRQRRPPSVLPSQVGEPVEENSDDGLNRGELGAKSKRQEHHEEENRPERRDRHPGNRLWIGDKGKASTWMMKGHYYRDLGKFSCKNKIGGLPASDANSESGSV